MKAGFLLQPMDKVVQQAAKGDGTLKFKQLRILLKQLPRDMKLPLYKPGDAFFESVHTSRTLVHTFQFSYKFI